MSAAGCKPSKTGVISMGVRCPIIRRGDDLRKGVVEWVIDALEENSMWFEDKDVIGITESIVARAQGNYVTVDDIVEFLRRHNYSKRLELYMPIMSRNRFSIILKAFARYADRINIEIDSEYDGQGNPTFKENPFTGINMLDYYKGICNKENCEMTVNVPNICEYTYIDCRCHPESKTGVPGYPRTLASIMNEPVMHTDGTVSGFNSDWGLLGSNKADEETLKLFPKKNEAQSLVDGIRKEIYDRFGKKVEILVYGDGNFCSPAIPGVPGSQINEWADPCNPAWTSGLNGSPNEIKVKALADGKFKNLNGKELEDAIKEEIRNSQRDLKGSMESQGTTPRRYTDLLASLCDLISGSGSRCTPIVYIHGYFDRCF